MPEQQPAVRPKITVEVISDTVCPWCFIGKRRLETAMRKFADKADFEVHWLPFFLNPNAPKAGVNKMQMYIEKFGAARVQQMMPQMTKTFADEGLAYSMGGLTGNTFDSHRLITWAAKFGLDKQNSLVNELMLNYFTQEKYLGDPAVLVAAADKVGLPGAAEFLADPNNGAQETRDFLRKAQGVTGVPFFIINDRMQLSGAQPSEQFEQVFEKLLKQ